MCLGGGRINLGPKVSKKLLTDTTTTGPKTPLQIRLDHAELAALDAYIAGSPTSRPVAWMSCVKR
jgi:hypothetical protein